jgi:predicted XRE-type DNA-binding protein
MEKVSKNNSSTSCGRPRRVGVIDPAMWEQPAVRRMLAARDIAGVFRLLDRCGLSQRKIAALTGVSQGEVSVISGGGRRVVSYDVLVRICAGLGIKRGLMGLAYSDGVERPGGEA